MAANYRESFIQRDDPTECVRMPSPKMMEDLKKQLIDDFDVDTPMIKLTPPGYMDVYLRVRPFSEEELAVGESQDCFQNRGNNTVAMHAPKDSKTFKNVAHGQGKATHSFTFSHVFGENTTQKHFFDTCTLPIIKDFINGQNCLVFTYGVTSAGKTYTLLGSPDNAGILPRGLDVVFNSIQNRQMDECSLLPRLFREVVSLTPKKASLQLKMKERVLQMAQDIAEPNMTDLLGADHEGSIVPLDESRLLSNVFSMDSLASMQSLVPSMPSISEDEVVNFQSMERAELMLAEADNRVREQTRVSVELAAELKFAIWVSFAEIYNEHIYDLLESMPTSKKARRTVLRLKEDEKGIPFIKGLKWIPVVSGDEAFKILTIGRRNLQVACTKLNKSSSRSHCIFSMKMIRTADVNNPHMARVNMLSFVDLAGSERYSKTKNVGAALREAAHINTSLLTLGRCLDTLRFNQHHKMSQKMVPFRESRLTRLFQSFFTGEGKAAMIVNINQNASMFDETLHALKFSAIAKQVTVVQKPEAARKPPVLKVVDDKQRKKSVALAKVVRDSVPWGSPRSLQRYMEMEETDKTLDKTSDKTLDKTLEAAPEFEVDNNLIRQELLATIEDLTTKLKEEKMRSAMMELKIREEVSAEMSKYIVKIETEYSERIEDVRAFEEERADQRIDLYINTIKKKKRRRDEEEETVTKESQLEEENKYLRAKIEELDDELAEARNDLVKVLSERDTMREGLSKAQFEIAGLKELATESENIISDSELIENLGRKLEEAQETIREQSEQMVELNELLSEAGQTFHDKEAEVEKLNAAIVDCERQLEEQTETISDLRKMVVEAKGTILQLEKRVAVVEQPCGDLSVSIVNQFDETMNFELREKVVNLEEMLAEKGTKVDCLEEVKTSLISHKETLETMNRDLMAQLEKSTEEIAKMNEEKSNLVTKVNSANVIIHELEQKLDARTELEAITKEMKAKKSELKDLLLEVESGTKGQKSLADTQKEVGKFKEECEKLNTAIDLKDAEIKTLNTAIDQKNAEIKTLNDKLEMKKSANQCYYEKMCKLEEELDEVRTNFEKLEDENEELLNEKSALEQIANQLSDKIEETKEQVRNMTDTMKQLEMHLKESESEKSVYIDQMKSLENGTSLLVSEKEKLELEINALTTRSGELYTMLKVANDKEVKLKTEKNEQTARITELEQSLEELDTAFSHESQAKSRLEEEVADLKQKLNKTLTNSSVQTMNVQFFTEKLSCEMNELLHQRDGLRTSLEESCKEVESLRKDSDELRAKCESLEKRSEEDANIFGKKVEAKTLELSKVRSEFEQVHTELVESTKQIETKGEESQKLHSEIDRLNNEIVELKTNLARTEKTIEEKEEECSSKSVAISALNCEITEMKNELALTEKKLQSLERTSHDVQEHTEKCRELESRVHELSQKLEMAEASVISAVQGRDRVEEQNETLEDEIQKLRSDYAELLEKYTDEVENMEKEIDKLRNEVKTIGEEKKITEETAEKWNIESDEKRTEKSNKDVKSVESELEVAKNEIDDLKGEVRFLNAEIENMLVERSQLMSVVRAMRKDNLHKCLTSESKSLKAVINKVETVVENGQKLQIMLRNSRGKNEELQKEVDQLNARLESQAAAFERLREKIEDCENAERATETRKLRDLTGERDALKTELNESKKRVSELRSVNEQLKNGLKDADESAQIEEGERKKLEKQLAELKARMDESATKSASRGSRLRLASKTSTPGPAARLFDSKRSSKEDVENIEPTSEIGLAERCIQVNLPSSAEKLFNSNDTFVSPETPDESAQTRSLRTSTRKTRSAAQQSSLARTEPANTGRSRKRCLMKTDAVFDASPDTDNALESQTSIESNDAEISVRRRLRTRRK